MLTLLNYKNKKIVAYVLAFFIGAVVFFLCGIMVSHTPNALLIEKFIRIPVLLAVSIGFYFLFLIFLFWITQKYEISSFKLIFYGTMLFFITGFLLAGALSHGESMRIMLFADKSDTFMDFYNSIQYGKHPYENLVIYPPLINAFYGFLGKFVLLDAQTGPLGLRVSQMGLMIMAIYMIVIYFILISLFITLKQGNYSEKILFSGLIMLSGPFLYAMDRGNSVVLALLFLLIFVYYYQSGNKYLRLLSYVALGIAAGIKISPALFGILLLRERRVKDAVLCAIIGVLIFIVPFRLTDGNLFTLIHNIAFASQTLHGVFIDKSGLDFIIGSGHSINLGTTLEFIGRLLNMNLYNLGAALNSLVLLMGMAVVLFDKDLKQWQSVGILSGILAITPAISMIYNLIYLSIPLILFLDSSVAEKSKWKYWYLVLFLGMLVPVVNLKVGILDIFFNDQYPQKISTVLESISLFLFIASLLLQGSIDLYHRNSYQSSPVQRRLVVITGVIVIAGTFLNPFILKNRAVTAYYQGNLMAGNALSGFYTQEGLYKGIKKEGVVRLKTEDLLVKGLEVCYSGDGQTSSAQNVKAFLDNQLVYETKTIDQDNNIVFVSANTLRDMNLGETVQVKIVNDNDEDSGLIVSYVGPAEFLDKLDASAFCKYASSGVFRSAHELWMGQHARVLLASDIRKTPQIFLNTDEAIYREKQRRNNKDGVENVGSTCKDGLLITYDVPKELFDANPEKVLTMDIKVNNEIVKTILLTKTGVNTTIINPKELFGAMQESDNVPTIDLSLDVNATYNNREMGTGAEKRDCSLQICYIGPCKSIDSISLPEHISWNFGNVFYIDTSTLKGEDLDVILKLPADNFMERVATTTLDAYINGTNVQSKQLNFRNHAYVDAMTIPYKAFSHYEGIVELKIIPANTNEMDLSKFELTQETSIKAIGTELLQQEISTEASKDVIQKISENLRFDDKWKVWTFGDRTDKVLSRNDITADGLCIKYGITPYLLRANADKEGHLYVYINGHEVRKLLLAESGDFELVMGPEEIKPWISDDTDVINLMLISDITCNLMDMRVSRDNIDRSIDIYYIGKCN